MAGVDSEAQPIQSARNNFFEVIGLDRRSVTVVDELNMQVARRAARYLNREGLQYPLPILVRLRPVEQFDFQGDHRIHLAARNAVELDVRWSRELSLERMCYLLSKAILLQYAVFNHGPGIGPEVRSWPIDALAMETYLSLRPAKWMHFQGALGSGPTIPLSVVLGGRLSVAPDPAAGFWAFQSIKSNLRDSRRWRAAFQQALAGVHVGESLATGLNLQFVADGGVSLENWWSGQVKAIIGRDWDAVESMEASRIWLEALARIDSIEMGEDTVAVDLRSLWQYRDSVVVRGIISARYEILRLRLGRCNPAYFNAARSLGALFETFLDAEPRHTYVHALVAYLVDWEDARDLEATLERSLFH